MKMNESLINIQLLAENSDNWTQIVPNINTNNSTAMDEDLTARNVIIISSYTLIIIISLCGNLLVCKIAFSSKKSMPNTTNILIASLACSDIVMTAFNIPFNVARLLLLDWPFGSVLCFLVPFIQTSCVYVSTFTITLIAIHRTWSLTKKTNTNMNYNNSNHRIIIAIIVIWLLAFTLSLPHSVFNEIKQVPYRGKIITRCRVSYPDLKINFRLLLTVEVFLTQYLLPLMTTTLLYIKIGCIVQRQGKVSVTVNNYRRRQQAEAKRRRIIMLALVVIVFAVCCYNPFIYCWRDDMFREGAQKLLIFPSIKFKRNVYRKQSTDPTDNCIKCRDNSECQQQKVKSGDSEITAKNWIITSSVQTLNTSIV